MQVKEAENFGFIFNFVVNSCGSYMYLINIKISISEERFPMILTN